MRRRRLLTLVAASAIAITLLTWVLLPYIFPPEIHTIDITMDYIDYLYFYEATSRANVRDLIPSKLGMLDPDPTIVYFNLGLLHAKIGGKSYDAVFLSLIGGQVTDMPVPQGFTAVNYLYLLDFFTNNSELGEAFHSYGLPHTYVEATYHRAGEGDVNRTLITMTYPNGSLLVEISYTTSGQLEPWKPEGSPGFYFNYYYLGNGKLAFLHWRLETSPYIISRGLPEGIGRLNMTVGEGSMIWKALGRVEYKTNIPLWATHALYRISGKVAWFEWK